MDPKPSSRRELLLKGSALAVGTVAAGGAVGDIALADTPAKALPSFTTNEAPMVPSTDATVAYGVRSHYVTSKRLQEPGRAVPAIYTDFGLTAHVFTPLQDSYGTIQASSLHLRS